MSERDIYNTPEDKVLLRTKDVYQTESEDDVASYSERLLAIVADFRNSGEPEGANAQSMVGKSKRGEVACRLFARIDPATGIIEAAGFKTRGCLAMTGCASAACQLVEGKPIEEALAVGIDDIAAFVDGVPSGKVNALHFAACAIQALVGDFLMRDGASLGELQEAVPCDADSISCIMAEHCSYRQSLLELRMEQAERQRRIDENNAVASCLEMVRENTRRGRLTRPSEWAALAPSGMLGDELADKVISLVRDAQVDDAVDAAPGEASAGDGESAMQVADASDGRAPSGAKASRFASRSVGVPSFFGKGGTSEGDGSQEEAPHAALRDDAAPKVPAADAASVLDGIEHVFDYGPHDVDDEDFDLVPPEGYKLVQVDGVWGLVETDEVPAPKPVQVDAAGIRLIEGSGEPYLFDGTQMTGPYAHWAYLAAEDDPLAAFACCVRDESRTYPRPMAATDFANEPLRMDASAVEDAWEKAQAAEGYEDIGRVVASNGDVYFFSAHHLAEDHARSLAEWSSVGRFMNV